MSTRMTLAAGACLAVFASITSSGARAQTFYLGGEAGWNTLEDQSSKFSGGLPSAHSKYDSGYAVGARAGYEMGPWRFEEEYNYRNNGLNRLNIGGFNVPGVSGSREAHAIMTNVIYDVDLGQFGINSPVTPHIGAGVGAVDIIDHAKAAGVGQVFNDNDWEFGYQAIAGLRYNVTPNVALDLDYRYLATTDASFKVPSVPAIKYRSNYENHTLMASMVYRFGPPAPPIVAPPAPPAPPPAITKRTFLVFFDWDRATITREGMTIIQQAANAYRSGAPVQIQVTGYTDRSGSPGYNQRLSERRANAVANAMAGMGVPRNDMAVSGRGENDNRVPTADGVREPQNRRVEIVFP
ncbi:MAG TPA: OmpA family protein [Stellaceae bacterium]|jgi:outer membrane protein OmpA-like peptidoglycan-associated protein|nr:OmpA family protein [Stellaceae bacterium]